jgi:serine/threonine-protein kinase RIO1
MLAFQMQQEEIAGMQGRRESSRPGRQAQGNVRSMTRAEIAFESQQVAALYEDEGRTWVGANSTSEPPPVHPLAQQALASAQQERARAPGAILETRPPARHPLEEGNDQEEAAGFRMNSASAQQWSRRDRNTIVGPNNEVRTKHDVQVQGQTNAEWLGLDADDDGVRAHVGNRALNSFRASLKQTSKGVASHGTGRAGSDSDAIKGRAMDPHVRLQISRAINAGLIESCNGAVKQGKEAIVYHADQGAGSNGFDVAVKVFKRIQEFRGRGEYVDGDPRYAGRPFRRLTEREQLELWTEKEFRNLVRANRAKVPVPSPLHYKENIIFMRFIGNGGWPAPQIRELEMRTGSKKWDVLYTQVMESVRR